MHENKVQPKENVQGLSYAHLQLSLVTYTL